MPQSAEHGANQLLIHCLGAPPPVSGRTSALPGEPNDLDELIERQGHALFLLLPLAVPLDDVQVSEDVLRGNRDFRCSCRSADTCEELDGRYFILYTIKSSTTKPTSCTTEESGARAIRRDTLRRIRCCTQVSRSFSLTREGAYLRISIALFQLTSLPFTAPN